MPHILLVGDLHGNPDALANAFQQAYENECLAIVQLGDFGFGWSVDEDGVCDYSYLTGAMVERSGIPFYFIDGNHENFDLLYALPLDGNGYRPVVEGVIHLPRGSVITFGNTKFLAFGGAYSVDKGRRTEGVSWWAQEQASDSEIATALAQSADIMLSHDAPFGIQTEAEYGWLGRTFGSDAVHLSQAHQSIVRKVFDASGALECYHGHLHRHWVRQVDERRCVTGLAHETSRKSTLLLSV